MTLLTYFNGLTTTQKVAVTLGTAVILTVAGVYTYKVVKKTREANRLKKAQDASNKSETDVIITEASNQVREVVKTAVDKTVKSEVKKSTETEVLSKEISDLIHSDNKSETEFNKSKELIVDKLDKLGSIKYPVAS